MSVPVVTYRNGLDGDIIAVTRVSNMPSAEAYRSHWEETAFFPCRLPLEDVPIIIISRYDAFTGTRNDNQLNWWCRRIEKAKKIRLNEILAIAATRKLCPDEGEELLSWTK